MSDELGCCLVRNTEDKCVRLRRHLQVKLPNQPIDCRRSVRLVSINLAGQPFARTVLLAHRQHWLNVARREWSKQQRARLKRHHRHHCLPNRERDKPPSTLTIVARIDRELTAKCWVDFIDW